MKAFGLEIGVGLPAAIFYVGISSGRLGMAKLLGVNVEYLWQKFINARY